MFYCIDDDVPVNELTCQLSAMTSPRAEESCRHRSPDIWATKASCDALPRRHTPVSHRLSLLTSRRSPSIVTGSRSSVVGRRLAEDDDEEDWKRSSSGLSSPSGRQRHEFSGNDVMSLNLLSPDSSVSFVHDNAALVITPDSVIGCSCAAVNAVANFAAAKVRQFITLAL